ncbi:hypothetical protein AN958_00121 [Leucoagaricus sp. SymC.cos]|nr:hypothetical protein AN958_00121 [Leucoagaricus sp. SymC.cos]
MQLHACFAKSFWEFAISTTVHLYNRTLVQCLGWKTLIEMASGQKPDVSYLKVFGYGMYIFISQELCKNKLSV